MSGNPWLIATIAIGVVALIVIVFMFVRKPAR